jgi:hypothetical protein
MHRPMIIDRQRGRVVVPRGNVRLGFGASDWRPDGSDWGRYDGRYVARAEPRRLDPRSVAVIDCQSEPPEQQKSGLPWGWILLAIFTGVLALPAILWLLLRAVDNFER